MNIGYTLYASVQYGVMICILDSTHLVVCFPGIPVHTPIKGLPLWATLSVQGSWKEKATLVLPS